MKYFNVSFKYSESVYCSNIARAEAVADVEAHYGKYEWFKISEATDADVRSAQERGKPIIECPHIDDPQKAVEAIDNVIASNTGRSAWCKGVAAYAAELVEELKENIRDGYIALDNLNDPARLERALLSGAKDWKQYSWGGCAMIYDGDIAARLCNPSELKKTRNGERRPNKSEAWLDVQARALFQACQMIKDAATKATRNGGCE